MLHVLAYVCMFFCVYMFRAHTVIYSVMWHGRCSTQFVAAAGKRIGLSDQYYICPVYHGEGPPERDEINAELPASLGLKIVMVTKAK